MPKENTPELGCLIDNSLMDWCQIGLVEKACDERFQICIVFVFQVSEFLL